MSKTTKKAIDGEIVAAICMALHEYTDTTVHDVESGVLCIQPTHGLWNLHWTTVCKMPLRKF